MRRRAAVLALVLACAAPIVVRSLADDLLRAFCAGIGPDHPLYDYMGCPAVMAPDPQG